MSLFANETGWGGSCISAQQSPVNLTQASSKPCALSCELVMDDGQATSAGVQISDEGLLILKASNSAGLGSCKFRGESYNCIAVHINHPSHHTIEGIQADGEVIAMFQKPTGDILCVSSLFRVNPTETPSYNFFKQTVPYSDPSTPEPRQVALSNWGVYMMVPPEGSYYVYSGSTVTPPCAPCEWVVFKSMINMDTTDFAFLVRNVTAGSRPVKSIANREIYFNDIQSLVGGPMPHDNKTYMRCRPTGKKVKSSNPVQKVDLKTDSTTRTLAEHQEATNPTTFMGKLNKQGSDFVKEHGLLGAVLTFVAIAAVLIGGTMGLRFANSNPFKGFDIVRTIGTFFRELIFGKNSDTDSTTP